MLSINEKYCLHCAIESFKIWKGWPRKDRRGAPITFLPRLMTIEKNGCRRCKGIDDVKLRKIYYVNVHGPYNTGLPDYFELKIDNSEGGGVASDYQKKYGIPYRKVSDGVIELDNLRAHVKSEFRYE